MAVPAEFRSQQAPVIVVGSGVAGLACALALAPVPVILITKTTEFAGGSSLLSQGGIAAALGPTDSPRQHAADTLRAGGELSERHVVESVVRDGMEAVREIIAAGFRADRSPDGSLALGREGAHSRSRIVHARGDTTGPALVATLLDRVSRTPSIELLPATLALDLLVENGRIAGLFAYRSGAGPIVFATPSIVLATGGAGSLWLETTNPAEATGDGLALAARARAQLADLEFVQFHPTALIPRVRSAGARLPLMTEALRGAGARLLDARGIPFMSREHALGDLAPRDVIARAIWRRRSAGEPVVLDLRPVFANGGRDAFPQALALCREAGYEPLRAPVPITPAAHYHMGGVLADEGGRTSIPGLWACGEIASTGMHGANRLAGNSLLEALVSAHRVADALRRCATSRHERAPGTSASSLMLHQFGDEPLDALRERLRTLMSRHVGIIRHGAGLSSATAMLEQLQEEFEAQGSPASPDRQHEFERIRSWSELGNMLLVSRLVTLAALRRTESRGAHFRSDFPHSRENWMHRQIMSVADLESLQSIPAVEGRAG